MLEPTRTNPNEDRRPYAPAANVLAILERVRRRNLPDVIDNDFMRIAAVSEGTMGRVAATLRFLGLVDDASRPTDRLRAMARADDDEYRELLAAVVRDAYAADFERVDPSQDPQPRIISAFQRYEPRSQTERMVMLFLGLVRAAGIPVLDAPRDRGMQTAPRVVARTVPSRGRVASEPARARASSTTAAPDTTRQQPTAPEGPAGLLFGVTIEDIGALPPEEFDTVWSALGKIAKARAASQKTLQDMADAAAKRRSEEDDSGAE